MAIKEEALKWLADICDGDARIALNSLEMTMKFSASNKVEEDHVSKSNHFFKKL